MRLGIRRVGSNKIEILFDVLFHLFLHCTDSAINIALIPLESLDSITFMKESRARSFVAPSHLFIPFFLEIFSHM
jgi:hypothetical protein